MGISALRKRGAQYKATYDDGRPEANVSGDDPEVKAWKFGGNPVDEVPFEATAQVKAEQFQLISKQAEAERLKYLTPGDGKAAEYTEKAREARAILASPTAALAAEAAEYPFAHAEAQRLKQTIVQVAGTWKNRIDLWVGDKGPKIAAAEQYAKDALAALPNARTKANHDAIRAIEFDLTWNR